MNSRVKVHYVERKIRHMKQTDHDELIAILSTYYEPSLLPAISDVLNLELIDSQAYVVDKDDGEAIENIVRDYVKQLSDGDITINKLCEAFESRLVCNGSIAQTPYGKKLSMLSFDFVSTIEYSPEAASNDESYTETNAAWESFIPCSISRNHGETTFGTTTATQRDTKTKKNVTRNLFSSTHSATSYPSDDEGSISSSPFFDDSLPVTYCEEDEEKDQSSYRSHGSKDRRSHCDEPSKDFLLVPWLMNLHEALIDTHRGDIHDDTAAKICHHLHEQDYRPLDAPTNARYYRKKLGLVRGTAIRAAREVARCSEL
jgi:hypothetical protein